MAYGPVAELMRERGLAFSGQAEALRARVSDLEGQIKTLESWR